MIPCQKAVLKNRVSLPRKLRWSLFGVLLATLPVAQATPSSPAQPVDPLVIPLAVTSTGHLTVKVNANGHPVRFVVDTACPVTIIDSTAYPKLAGATSPAVGRTFYPKTLAYRAAAVGAIADLRIGGKPLGRVPVGVTALDTVLGRSQPDAEGILGSDLLLRCDALIDLRSGTLVLNPTAGQKAALAQRVAREGYTAVTMSPTDGLHLAVPCVLSNVPQRLVVDTGSPGTVVQRAVLNSSELVRPLRVSYLRTLGGGTTVAWLPLQNWSIGDFPVESAVVETGNFRGGIFTERTSNGGQVAGQLGLESLAHFRALVDFGNRKIYLRNTEARPAAYRNPALTQQPRLSSGGSMLNSLPALQTGSKARSR